MCQKAEKGRGKAETALAKLEKGKAERRIEGQLRMGGMLIGATL
jgi:hypothetical protein